MASLQRLAEAAVVAAPAQGILTRQGVVAQWRRRMETALQFAAADAILNALSQSDAGRQAATRWCSTRPVPAPLVAYVDGNGEQAQPQPTEEQPRTTTQETHASNSQLCRASDAVDCDLETGLGDIITADVMDASMPQADLLTADEEAAWHLFGDSSLV